MPRESDLLFGLLALQMNFVSRDQLLECAPLWTSDPARRLDRMLLERGHLKEFQRAAVSAMVDAQLRSHGGDPASSLAAASVDSSVRDSLMGLRGIDGAKSSPAPGVAEGGRYRLGKELGHGGLGTVVEAFDANLEREVAIKMLLDGASGELAERFVREAKLAGRLDHPNIVPVHDFGTLGGHGRRLFLAMKRVRGRDLGQVLEALSDGDEQAKSEYSRTKLLQVFQDICLGAAFAHDRGVIHRDLKPANVMLGDYGEVLIVDWGLARVMDDRRAEGENTPEIAAPAPDGPLDPDATIALPPSGTSHSATRDSAATALTLDGEVLGTPAYMSPEQAEGWIRDCDARSDIYSLGVILYQILTLRTPFQGRTPREILRKVRAGGIVPPSTALKNHSPSAAVLPAELDAICLKALAFRKQDRFRTALELHREIQLFLEGVKERERTEKEARERVEKGRAQLGRYRALAGEIEEQSRAVKELSEKTHLHLPIEEKRPLWEAEQRLTRLREERIIAFSSASAEFGQALVVNGDSVEALDGKCDLLLDRFVEAEKKRDHEEMLLNRRTLETYDRQGRYRAKLDAPGKLSIRTFAYGCDCLKPVRHPEWRVEIAEKCTVPWRDGRARPDLVLTDRDRPTPAVRTHPEGVRWGHSGACIHHEIRGAEVWIAQYEERDKRLQLGEMKRLGMTPLVEFELPQGSWRCTLKADGFAETLLPVRVDRGGAWTQDVHLYRPDEIPPGFCYVPGGPFVFGGLRNAAGYPEESKVTEDTFVARFPVTAGEYLEFLNDLSTSGRREEALQRQPREGEARYFAETASGFSLPSAEDPKSLLKGPGYPVFGVSWVDSIAYASWRAKRDGLTHSLLHEEEWEKAARGVDARIHPYGDRYDGTYSHTNLSVPTGMKPLPVGTYSVDESPYGVRDMAGGVVTWLLNAPEAPQREYCCMRGGSWATTPERAQSAYRLAFHPTIAYRFYGLRLTLRPA
ncbi:MAG: serine/threonine protein [Planctomycetota bacterium]|nr:MAG: serine/threonine protein [Planctomycetota bacterium]